MLFQELQQTIEKLSVEERLTLLSAIAQSVQRDLQPQPDTNKRAIVDQLRGCLKQQGKTAPTDAEIEAMREERLVEKYLK
jgi:hypothetical protein